MQRGKKSIVQAKRDYESVKNFRVGDVPKDAIDIVEHEALAYKQAGSHKAKTIAGTVRTSYLIDYAANTAAYWQFAFSGMGGFVASAIWIWAGVNGAEKFVKLWQHNEDAVKAESKGSRFPKVIPFVQKDKPPESKSESA